MPGITFRSHSTPSSHAVLGLTPRAGRSGREGAGGVDQPAAGERVGETALRQEGMAKPDHPFKNEETPGKPIAAT